MTNEHPLTSILNQLAEEGVPDDRAICAAVRSRLQTSKTDSLRGGFAVNTVFQRSGRAAAALLMLIALFLAALLATPQGRALAQAALHFFTRSTQEQRSVPTLLPMIGTQTPDGMPTSIPTATPRPVVILAFQAVCGSLSYARCSLEQIQERVDFPVRALSTLPDGWEWVGATGGPEMVWLMYQSEAGRLLLLQGPKRYPEPFTWPVGTQAQLESVQIGELPGEYVQGAWLDADLHSGTLVWEDDTPERTLRWEQAETRFSLLYIPAKSSEGVRPDKAMLTELAASLTTKPAEENIPTANPIQALEEIVDQAGFEVRTAGWLPKRFAFEKVVLNANVVCQFYGYPESEGFPNLVIVQTPRMLSLADLQLAPQYYNNIQIDIPLNFEATPLDGAMNGQALYAWNGLDLNPLCNLDGINSNHLLLWQADGMSFVVSGALDQFDGREFLTRMEMLRIAESLNGATGFQEGKPDPEYLPSAAMAEALAGFSVKTPTWMPQDARFEYAFVRDSNGSPEVGLVYFSPTRDSIERRHSYLFFQKTRPENTLAEQAQGGGEWVQVSGMAAVFSQACWDRSGQGGDPGCNLTLSWVDASGVRHDIEVYQPGVLDRALLIAIAESMH